MLLFNGLQCRANLQFEMRADDMQLNGLIYNVIQQQLVSLNFIRTNFEVCPNELQSSYVHILVFVHKKNVSVVPSVVP